MAARGAEGAFVAGVSEVVEGTDGGREQAAVVRRMSGVRADPARGDGAMIALASSLAVGPTASAPLASMVSR
ncbi:MAG: hypothetical protein U0841_26255 [Chloroflexia bacterium]